jgi:transposase
MRQPLRCARKRSSVYIGEVLNAHAYPSDYRGAFGVLAQPAQLTRKIAAVHVHHIWRQWRQDSAGSRPWKPCASSTWSCRHFGISRKTFYKWKRRFDAVWATERGAAAARSDIRWRQVAWVSGAGPTNQPRPTRSPKATKAAVVSKILYRREQYHFGPGRIADYLKRFHQVAIAQSSVHRILSKHGMNRLPANQKHRPHKQRWQRYGSLSQATACRSTSSFSSASPGLASGCTSSPRSMIAHAFAC